MATGEPKWFMDMMKDGSGTPLPLLMGRISAGSSNNTGFVYFAPTELVRTKATARERIAAALSEDARFAHWKKKEVAQLIDALVDALADTSVSFTQ